ncbi:MAG: hypothetical protein K2K74_18055 [Lachnospiraceae bacterium]|nr:hypothetical protein [Lachnospiraceae bacterium]
MKREPGENVSSTMMRLTSSVDWSRKKNKGLRTLLLYVNNLEIIKLLIEWTELLAQEKYKEALEKGAGDTRIWFCRLQVTSLQNNPYREKTITDIDISSDYEGWMGKNDLAVVHYEEVSLNGKMSDLTARFFVTTKTGAVKRLSGADLRYLLPALLKIR